MRLLKQRCRDLTFPVAGSECQLHVGQCCNECSFRSGNPTAIPQGIRVMCMFMTLALTCRW